MIINSENSNNISPVLLANKTINKTTPIELFSINFNSGKISRFIRKLSKGEMGKITNAQGAN